MFTMILLRMKGAYIMKNILCFGDSNTYGYKPDGSGRFDYNIRYTGVLQGLLGDNYHIIEEGCPGRTTVFNDTKRPYKNGYDYIIPCVQSHTPLDYLIIMLGTNDCKQAFNASAIDIANGLEAIIKAVKSVINSNSNILIICPIHLGEHMGITGYDPDFNKKSIFTSYALGREYKKIAVNNGCMFLDGAVLASPSTIDDEHLDEIGHLALGTAVANIIIKNEQHI